MVAYISSGLEWFQHPQTSRYIKPRYFCPNRCTGNMGLCSSASPPLVTVAIASGMAEYWDHGQGAGANHSYLYCLPYLSRRHITFQCDNANLVISINKGSCKDKLVMHLLCSLSFFVAHFDIYLTAFHLPGLINIIANRLSRGNLHQALQATPSLSPEPTPIPPSALQLLSPHRLDWISPHFPELFQQTLSFVSQHNC